LFKIPLQRTSDICEWNLDNLSKQGILDLTCQMSMAATTYKTRKCLDRDATIAIIQGFTGQKDGGMICARKREKNYIK